MYDLWGETVNIASRMESHGLEGHIQVTERVKNTLNKAFRFTPRGTIEVRGVGAMDVWLLEDRQVKSRTDLPAPEFIRQADRIGAFMG